MYTIGHDESSKLAKKFEATMEVVGNILKDWPQLLGEWIAKKVWLHSLILSMLLVPSLFFGTMEVLTIFGHIMVNDPLWLARHFLPYGPLYLALAIIFSWFSFVFIFTILVLTWDYVDQKILEYLYTPPTEQL